LFIFSPFKKARLEIVSVEVAFIHDQGDLLFLLKNLGVLQGIAPDHDNI